MEGFRNKTYLTDPTGFRSKALSFNPILAGSQNSNFQALELPDYVSYADLQAQKAAAAAANQYVPVIHDDGNDHWGGGNDDHGGGGWGGNEQGDAPGSEAGTYNTGGAIPPMYAVEGSYIDELLGLANNRTAFDTTTGLMQDMVDPITATVKDAFTTVDDYAGTAYSLAEDKVKGVLGVMDPNQQRSYQDLKATSQIKSAIENQFTVPNLAVNIAQLLGEISTPEAILAKELGAPLVEKVGAFLSEHGDIGKDKRTADAARKLGVNPIAKEYASVGDYGIDDTLDPNMGAIPGDYSPKASSISKNSIDSWQDLNNYISNIEPVNPGRQLDFDSQLEAAISAELGDYTDSMETSTPSSSPSMETSTPAPSSSMSDHAAVHGSSNDGYDGGDSGHTGGNASDGSEAQSDGYGALGHSRGGRIYASQGGYVNSTGGK